MKLIEINWRPNDRKLRQFGAMCAVALPGIAWLWGGGRDWILGMALLGMGAAVLAWVAPRLVRPLFVGLSLATLPIGMVVGELAMLTIFYGMFLPLGLAMKLVGRDALELKRRPKGTSYWRTMNQPTGAGSYYRQS